MLLYVDDTAWLPIGVQPLNVCHACRGCLLLTIDRWMGVKMLFRSSRPIVRSAASVVGDYLEKGTLLSTLCHTYAHGVHFHTRHACTKARPDGGWAAVLLGSNSICMLT